jgi:carboxylesterase type B
MVLDITLARVVYLRSPSPMKILAAVITAVLASCTQAQTDGTTVQTQQGPVTGTLVSPVVRQFLGIPYAVANRWEAPQPPAARTVALDATSFGNSCVQALTASAKEFLTLSGVGDQSVPESEDCLSVNVWAPSLDRKQGTAVMLWIYGGSFDFGTVRVPI